MLASVSSMHAALNVTEVASFPAAPALGNSGGASGNTAVQAGNSKGQTVSLSGTAHLTGAVFQVNNLTAASDITLAIYPSVGGLPDGAAVFSDSGTLPGTLTGGDYVQMDFQAQVNLAAGDYVIVLETTNSDLSLRLNNSNGYQEGQLVRNNDSTEEEWAPGGNANSDLVFALLGSIDPPSPLTINEVSSFPSPTALANTGGSSSSTLIDSGNAKGQTFTFGGAAELTGMVIQIDQLTVADDLTLEIYQTSGGLPDGDALFTRSGTLPAGLDAGDYVQIDFPEAVNLTAGDYAIVFSTVNSDLSIRLNGGDGYTSGRVIRKNADSSGVWANGAVATSDFVFGLLGSIDAPPTLPMASTGPNIIFILADDLGWTDNNIAAMNGGNQSDFYQTPSLTRLANEGVSFTSAYAQPNCAPTRAALMTGQYSCRSGNGVYNVSSLNRGGGRTTYTTPANQGDEHIGGDEETVTIAEAFYNSGYVTAHFGKYHVGSSNANNSTHPLNQGFDYNYGGGNPGNPGDYFATAGKFHNNVGPELDPFAADYTTAYINDNLVPYNNGNNPSSLNGTRKFLTDAIGDAVLSFMDQHRTGSMAAYPFYAQVHFYAVHTPIQGRQDLVTKYNGLPAGTRHDNATYAALLENMDHSIGRILDYLDDPNNDDNTADSIADNTLIIFTSDNGGHMGPTTNLPLRGRKGMHYEGGIRVPLVMRMPGTIPAGKVSESMVHSVDYYPTMLDFASGVFPDASTHPVDGESLHAHVLDPDNVARDRAPIFYHFPGYMDSRTYACSAVIKDIGQKRFKYIYAYDPYYDPGNDGTTNNATKGFDQYQLYNLTDDIGETVNLMDYIDVENSSDPNDPSSSREYWDYILYKDIANEMAADLNQWLQGPSGDSTWNPIYSTYKSNFPGIAAELIGEPTGPAPASVVDIDTPLDQSFRVTSSAVNQGTGITLTFSSEPGFRYQIQGSSNLTNGSWGDLGSVIEATGNSTTHSAPDPDAGEDRRFYRVVLKP
ncbi:hypothetical protein NT6N_29300 [Oceaniferula spumae]|uniref:Sulfatase N-terminal domain-containing protein n=1 Tax=Oceaniferula spumae TaxID=2979115 RepID=A0AAT9FPG7_9BACT